MTGSSPSTPFGAVSAFFPCYNDAESIEWVVTRALDALRTAGGDFEVIVVDDGSSDRSAELLAEVARREPEVRIVSHPTNRGYGAALRSGFAAARNEWVFYTDGDGQYDPSELTQLLAAAGPDVDVVQGYKLKRGDGWTRRLVGRVYHHTVATFFRLRIRDTDCDFRLMRRSVLDQFELTRSTGVICVELVHQLQSAGARFVEVGVHHYPRRHGTSMFFRPVPLARTLVDLGRLWAELVLRKRGAVAAVGATDS